MRGCASLSLGSAASFYVGPAGFFDAFTSAAHYQQTNDYSEHSTFATIDNFVAILLAAAC